MKHLVEELGQVGPLATGIAGLEIGQVGAGAKTLSRPGEDRDPRLGFCALQRDQKTLAERTIDGVVAIGPVQGDHCDPVIDRVIDSQVFSSVRPVQTNDQAMMGFF